MYNVASKLIILNVYYLSLSVQTKSMVYEQEVYNQFTYSKDRLYFHSFPGDVSFFV